MRWGRPTRLPATHRADRRRRARASPEPRPFEKAVFAALQCEADQVRKVDVSIGPRSQSVTFKFALTPDQIAQLEGERSQEIAVKTGTVHGGFFMPHDFKVRGKHRLKRRDFATTTGTGAVGITVESTFIELLRNRIVADELGVTISHSLTGKYAKPRQSGASTMYFIGEGSSGTGSNPPRLIRPPTIRGVQQK
jgi:hypothetical protein